MDLTAAQSSSERELAQLRARAYGPGADIHLDAEALARLRELEAVALFQEEPAEDQPGPSPESAMPSHADESSTLLTVTSPEDTESAPARTHWWQKVPVWALIAGAAVIGLLIGLIGPALMAPRAVAQLRPTPAADDAFGFDWYDIDRDTLVRYDDYGEVEVWTADTVQGIPCLFVSVGAEWVSMGCAPGELDPTVDLNIFAGMPAIGVLELPPGSVVRFVLRGDVVSVWTAEPAAPTPVSS